MAKATDHPDPSFHSHGAPGIKSQQAPGTKGGRVMPFSPEPSRPDPEFLELIEKTKREIEACFKAPRNLDAEKANYERMLARCSGAERDYTAGKFKCKSKGAKQ